MIESYYWKEKIRRAADLLDSKKAQKRWSSRSIDFFERELMIAFFCVRKLIEAKKLTDSRDNLRITVFRFRNVGMPADIMNLIEFEKVYDLSGGRRCQVTIDFAANQLIHAFFIFPSFTTVTHRLDGIWVTSDFQRPKALYRFPLVSLVKSLRHIATDQIRNLRSERNPKTGEWVVVEKK